MISTVPIDEGEAEAQQPGPVFVMRLLDGTEADFPMRCRVEVDAAWKRSLKAAGLDAALTERTAWWIAYNAWQADSPVLAWENVEGVHCRTATFTVHGYAEETTP